MPLGPSIFAGVTRSWVGQYRPYGLANALYLSDFRACSGADMVTAFGVQKGGLKSGLNNP